LATKMLASTVQFSRYGRRNDGSPRARPACSARPSGSFGGSMCRTVRIRRANTPEGSFRSLRTQQRAYAIVALGSDFHASVWPYWQTDDFNRELVSVPPLSSVMAA